MFDTFLLTHRVVKSFDGSLYRLLEEREVVGIASRMMDFGEQNKVLNTISII